MDASLSSYIEFQYSGARDVFTALMTGAGGALAVSWLFAKDFLSVLQAKDRNLVRHVMGSLGAIGLAAFIAGHGLIENYILMTKAQRLLLMGKMGEQRLMTLMADAHRAFGLSVLFYAALMVAGFFMLLAKAAQIRKLDRKRNSEASLRRYKRIR